MEQQGNQGQEFTDWYVCTACVDDYALEAALSATEEASAVCSFCERSPAAELGILLERFVAAVHREYAAADDEGVGYAGGDGGYQWHHVLDPYDVVEDLGGHDVLVGKGLFDAVCGAIPEQPWVHVDFAAPRRDEALGDSWARFCTQVKHRTRYVFWRSDMEESLGHGEMSAGRILDEVGDLIEDLGLLKELPARTRLWRALTHSEPQVDWSAQRLGTAPLELARQANRMNPAGIPMFYGALDKDTAVRETALHSEGLWATAAAFETSRPCTIVDFTNLPDLPSRFDPKHADDRRNLMFLRNFAHQLSKPVRPAYEQIDYVPTQVVTEYLLHVFRPGVQVSGLKYSSSLTGKSAVVLNVPNQLCIDPRTDASDKGGSHLALVIDPASRHTVEAPAT